MSDQIWRSIANDNSDFSAVDLDANRPFVASDDEGQVQQSCNSSESEDDSNLLEQGNNTENIINAVSEEVDFQNIF